QATEEGEGSQMTTETKDNNTALAKRQAAPETVADILLDQGRALTELQARFQEDLKDPRAARQFLALCLTYDLDPLMGELVPFAGRPYITDAGWLKLIQKHAPGQLVQLDTRQAHEHEKRELELAKGDWLAIA